MSLSVKWGCVLSSSPANGLMAARKKGGLARLIFCPFFMEFIMPRHFLFGILTLVLIFLAVLSTAPADAQNVSEKVQADWVQQERNAARVPGSRESLTELAVSAGKLLLWAEKKNETGKPVFVQKVAVLRETLAQAEQKLQTFPEGEEKPNFVFRDGWFFESVLLPDSQPEKSLPRVVCTQGGTYDFRSVFTFEDGTPYPVALCRTGGVVRYLAEGLKKERKYQLRLVFTSDLKRVEKLLINGREIEDVKVPVGLAVEKLYPLEGVTEAQIELQTIVGPNVTIAEVDLLDENLPGEELAGEAQAEKRAELAAKLPKRQEPAAREEWFRLRSAMREVLFASPEIDFEELLFVKRHWPQGNHQCGHRVGENQTAGADLMILKGLSPDGEIRGLLPPQLAAKCGIGRPDLSHDAQRIVFPLAWPCVPPTPYPWGAGHRHYDPKNPTDCTWYHGGACQPYDIFEMNVDGSNLRNLTNNPEFEDSEPCWLPDGRILFTSTRGGRFVQCGDWSPVFGLHVMNGDGTDVHAITQPQDTEFYPSLLEDGRILFTRWDYVMKPYNTMQELWAINPDGTRAQKIYGDWYQFSRGPIAMQEARQIPGTRSLTAVGCAHHNSGVGPLLTVNTSLNRHGPEGMKLLTPEIPYPEISGMRDERKDPNYQDLNQVPARSGWFTSPWPLSDRLFLCVFSYYADNLNDSYGIYLMTDFGFKELVLRLEGTSCYCPIPLKSRPKPPVIADHERLPAGTPAFLVLQDVYQGLPGVARGTVRWLRVCETYPKLRHTNPHRADAGISSGWDFRGVLGYVPVAKDGSASFEVPSDRMIFLSAVDENFQEIQRMRNYVTLRPGEVQGCVGCHENPLDASPVSRQTQGPRAPEKIQPPAYGAGPMQFERVIQPILNAKCIGCHDGSQGEMVPDLRGGKRIPAGTIGDPDEGPQHRVTTAFAALVPHVSYYQLTSNGGFKTFQPPHSMGSGVSALTKRLTDTQCGKALTPEERRAFCDWIDCNAPYYGSYDEDFLAP